MRSPILLTALLTLTAPALLYAQEAPQTQGVMVVRYFKCDQRTIPELREFFRTAWRPHIDRVVREGRLLSYGELGHAWGDEWNVVDYFTAPDLEAALDGIGAAHAAASEQTPDFIGRVSEYCSEHKDNIYMIRHLSPAGASPPLSTAEPASPGSMAARISVGRAQKAAGVHF